MTLNKNTVSLMRRYIFEVAIIGLTAAVVTLFFKIDNLNIFIRETLMEQNNENRKAIEHNTNALNNIINHQTQTR